MASTPPVSSKAPKIADDTPLTDEERRRIADYRAGRAKLVPHARVRANVEKRKPPATT